MSERIKMETLKLQTVGGDVFSQTDAAVSAEVEPSSLQRVASAVVHLAERAVSFFPTAAPDGASEHFGRAQKRNDPNPVVDAANTTWLRIK